MKWSRDSLGHVFSGNAYHPTPVLVGCMFAHSLLGVSSKWITPDGTNDHCDDNEA